MDRLDEIRKRLEAITPWRNEVHVDRCRQCTIEGREGEFDIDGIEGGYHGTFGNRREAEFIASAPEDIAWLLARVEELSK